MNRFVDQRVLVTAGVSGIGRAIAEAFAVEGAAVHVVDIDSAAINTFKSQAPDHIDATEADVSDETAVKKVFIEQQKRFRGIDVLVNCAGIKGPTELVENIELADWQRCLDVNLQSTFLMCKYAIPMLRQHNNGSFRRPQDGMVILCALPIHRQSGR